MIFKDKYIDIHSHKENSLDDRVEVLNVYPDKLPNFNKEGLYSLVIHPWFIPEKGVGKLLKIIEESAKLEEVVAI